ncbi:MAG: decaprenyl-phosphate phosphoribosyltransferase [Bacillota bacterium]
MSLQTQTRTAFKPVAGTTAGRSQLYWLIKAMRPRQWTKNLVIFAGIIFSKNLLEPELLGRAAAAFGLFCLISGSVYIINDLVDLERDRVHPKKRHRPLAAGLLSVPAALTAVAFAGGGSLAAAFYLDNLFGLVAAGYFLLVLTYSLWLKNIVIIDVLTIGMGFILRAVAGAVVISVSISPWLLVCTYLLALFLALTKRRHERLMLEAAHTHRKILREYQPEMLEQMISVVTSSTVMAYSLYTFTAGHSRWLMATIPFVIYGIFRYQYLVHQKDIGGSPEMALLKDIPLLVNVALWVVASALILYLTK